MDLSGHNPIVSQGAPVLGIKNTETEMKNVIDRPVSKVDRAKGRNSELEDILAKKPKSNESKTEKNRTD